MVGRLVLHRSTAHSQHCCSLSPIFLHLLLSLSSPPLLPSLYSLSSLLFFCYISCQTSRTDVTILTVFTRFALLAADFCRSSIKKSQDYCKGSNLHWNYPCAAFSPCLSSFIAPCLELEVMDAVVVGTEVVPAAASPAGPEPGAPDVRTS